MTQPLHDMAEEEALLTVVEVVHRLEDGGVRPQLANGPDEGPHVLGKARSAITHPREEELGADALITADASADHVPGSSRPRSMKVTRTAAMPLKILASGAIMGRSAAPFRGHREWDEDVPRWSRRPCDGPPRSDECRRPGSDQGLRLRPRAGRESGCLRSR